MKRLFWLCLIIVCLLLLACFIFRPTKTAVIVDQLGLCCRNFDFEHAAANILRRAGYRVMYVPHEQATVAFFQQMPAQGYDLILLRVHSSASVYNEAGEIVPDDSVSLCTGEPVSSAYLLQRNSRRIGGFETEGSKTLFFSVRGDFFAYDAEGRFDKSVIMLMGCEGLRVEQTARTLLDRGASAVIGWTGKIDTDRMDQAALALLRAWLAERRPLPDAVAAVSRRFPAPPEFQSSELRILQEDAIRHLEEYFP